MGRKYHGGAVTETMGATMGTTNTLFNYLYRDAGNYKRWGEIVFAGAPSDAFTLRLKKVLYDGALFIASQVNVPDVSFEASGTDPRDNDDHPWHEFSSMENSSQPPNDPSKRTIEELVGQFERAAKDGWRPKSS
jgi:hypothetical protein